MNIVLQLAAIGICVLGLWLGAVWVVESSTRIARHLGVSELVIGLTVVAIGTSLPEFTVTMAASLQGLADISVGNVMGSNIFNLGFILGGVALMTPLVTSRVLVNRDGMLTVGAALLVLGFLYDLELTRWEGAILFFILVVYTGWLIYRRAPIEEETPVGKFQWFDIPRLLVGLVLVTTSGYFLVEFASGMARQFGVSEWVIGVTIVAAGTSMPEAATSLVAIHSGRHGISAGNLIGSTIFNLLGVLGLAALVRPLVVDDQAIASTLTQLVLTILVVILMRTAWKITRIEGAILFMFAAMTWIADIVRPR